MLRALIANEPSYRWSVRADADARFGRLRIAAPDRRLRSRLVVLAVGLMLTFHPWIAGAWAQDSRDPVRDTVEQVGSTIGDVFRHFGDDLGQIFVQRTKRTVDVDPKYVPGTIIVRTRERKLYYVTDRGRALRYSVGVGREGFEWGGNSHISRKAEWPEWRPPKEMLERLPGLPTYMPGGPNNPLGARALYIGDTLYRIHGTSEAHTIGGAVSSGCIRMLNNDVIDLYDRVRIGAPVFVYH